MPKYKVIYEQIVNKIESGQFDKTQKLPSERALADEFEVSINTLRKALSLLIDNGYIVSKHGSGYYLSDHKNFNSLKLKSMGSTYSKSKFYSNVLDFSIVQANQNQANLLGIEFNEAIYHVKRLRFIDDKPAIIENTIIPVKLFPTLKRNVFDGSFYRYIEEETDHKIDRAIKDVSAIIPNSEQKQLLNIKSPRALLVLENYVYLKSGEQFEYSYNIHVDDKISILINNI